jgi:hypothetical protein
MASIIAPAWIHVVTASINKAIAILSTTVTPEPFCATNAGAKTGDPATDCQQAIKKGPDKGAPCVLS